MKKVLALIAAVGLALTAQAAVVHTTQHGPLSTSFDAQIAVNDVIAGIIGTELPGDLGWHPANGDPLDKLPAFTDGIGIRPTGLTGLLNDFPPVGAPAKIVRYDFPTVSIAGINILTGNNGRDGRVFSTTVIRYSLDGTNFAPLGYFQSDPSGTINQGTWGSTLVSIYDDASGTLLAGVQSLIFELYAVDNTGGQMRDPFDGINPWTGVDDGLTAAFVSPLVFELDVIAVPEPAALGLLALGVLVLRRR